MCKKNINTRQKVEPQTKKIKCEEEQSVWAKNIPKYNEKYLSEGEIRTMFSTQWDNTSSEHIKAIIDLVRAHNFCKKLSLVVYVSGGKILVFGENLRTYWWMIPKNI